VATWIYKCNARNAPYQVSSGDWDDFFAEPGDGEWGSTEWNPELRKAHPRDTILAYQTDRNELVGIAKVVRQRKRGAYSDLILRPVEEIRVKLRPLKKRYASIARIPALQPGPIQTLYPIAAADALRLLRAARSSYRVDIDDVVRQGAQSVSGAGFGTAEENRKVEAAAIKYVREYFRAHGWVVRDVSGTKCGYDLECRRGRATFHVEVKGTRGVDQKFILTRNEERTWKSDRHFTLALVTKVLSSPALFQFRGARSLSRLCVEPIAYVCTLATAGRSNA
jgi:Domain of unknown function (DUF3883)